MAGVGSAALGGWWAVRAGAEDGPGPASMQTRGIFSWVEAGLAAGSLLRHTPATLTSLATLTREAQQFGLIF